MMNKIKEARLKTGLTIKKVAESLGIPQRTYESWEGGQRKPTDYVIRHVVADIEKLGEKNQDYRI
ncbi:helix-turn-helix domain-containing protein [Veillonella montpellierensis]|uniref:helix-turn-helix domain-containing protein n=1 Tax=Veillonella montpellierensis TaxID=187328 RepID=UPI003C704844